MNVDTILWRAGWATLGSGAVCLGLSLVDGRRVGGVNTWLKPLKFALSVGVYLLTVALLLPLAEISELRRAWLSWGIPLSIGGTFLLVVVQGGRGVKSHFNVSTRLNAGIFHFMGLMITIHTVLMGVLLWSFYESSLPLPLAWGIRLGLVSAMLGSVQGFSMTSRLSHTVGAADGGPGLPFFNFSTRAGDLRVAHLLALHGLQTLPLAGCWMADLQVPRGSLLVWLLFLAQVGLSVLALLQALAGKPLRAVADSTSKANS